MPFLKIPHIPQRNESDCLVACAAMLLAAVGVNTDYYRLQRLFRYEGSGISYRKLHLLTRIQSNLNVTIRQGTLQHLMTAIDAGTPPAVFVFTGELPYWSRDAYHAVVLTGYTEADFYINDPAFADAPQIVSIGDLDLAWLANESYFAVVQRRSR